MTPDELRARKGALVIAHPGHELRVHGWLEIARPTVFVLTDGSGHTGQSRLSATERVLEAAGAARGRIFGPFTDADLYELMRVGNVAPLLRVTLDLVAAFSAGEIDYVVGDALEGFNPSHDLCRFLINAAVLVAQRESGRTIENFDFLLDGDPRALPQGKKTRTALIELNEDALRRKLDAADGYEELKGETQTALTRFGPRAFMTECLRAVDDPRAGVDSMEQEPPQYEQYGEQRVRHGYYAQVIRYRTNVRPLLQDLWDHAGLDDLMPGSATSTTASAQTGVFIASSHPTDS